MLNRVQFFECDVNAFERLHFVHDRKSSNFGFEVDHHLGGDIGQFTPRRCSSNKCLNLHIVGSSGTGSQPKSMPTNVRSAAESYKASSTSGSGKSKFS